MFNVAIVRGSWAPYVVSTTCGNLAFEFFCEAINRQQAVTVRRSDEWGTCFAKGNQVAYHPEHGIEYQ